MIVITAANCPASLASGNDRNGGNCQHSPIAQLTAGRRAESGRLSQFVRCFSDTLQALGHCKLMTGSIEEVIPLIEQAIRLSPRDPQIAVMYYRKPVLLLMYHISPQLFRG
jgi:hypothetical protein